MHGRGFLLSFATVQDVTVYTLSGCGFCVRAKLLLDEKAVPYNEINVTQDPDAADEVRSRTGHWTFPQVFVGTEFVGGFTELATLEHSGRLDDMLS